jgi:hypothetical protein
MKVRLLPGQVVVREVLPEASASLWTPQPGPREVRTHVGRVLALGPPARLNGSGPEVPHGFEVGDLVQYHLTHLEKVATNPWPPDGEMAVWVQQENVDGVWVESFGSVAEALEKIEDESAPACQACGGHIWFYGTCTACFAAGRGCGRLPGEEVQ